MLSTSSSASSSVLPKKNPLLALSSLALYLGRAPW
uniref:Uncharacterized protein n=1 Tax=Brassica oleracea TaxID=3712 RepID=A0A3P6EYC3_BRAOL|nr:unnamed protein product [Brassica oleracea]